MEGHDEAGDAAGAGAANVERDHPSAWDNITDEEMEVIVARLIEQRGMTAENARFVVTNKKCEECKCLLGVEVSEDMCMCSCHCLCCCAPLFRCESECACSCECHYEAIPESDSGDESDTSNDSTGSTNTGPDSIVSATPDGDQTEPTDNNAERGNAPNQEPSGQPSHGDTAHPPGLAAIGVTAGSASTAVPEAAAHAQGKGVQQNDEDVPTLHHVHNSKGTEQPPDHGTQENGERESGTHAAEERDEDMMKAPALPTAFADRSTGQIYHLYQEQLQASEESAKPNCLRIVAELFARSYNDTIQPGQNKQKPNKLPQLTPAEAELLHTLVAAVIRQRKYTFQRVLGLFKELALASAKSKWSFTNILNDRVASANEAKSTPANEWSQRATTQATKASLELTEAFRFDPRVYADDDVHELRAICTQHHVFPTTRRTPTPNEWRVIVGMMDGTIIHKAIPTFLKRCCDARQMAWIQTQIRDRAEGELWARLPPSFAVYDYNQTSKRIIGQIRRDASRLKWPDDKLFHALGLVKAAAYDKKKHSLHLFFFTKMDAALADGIVVPYRNAKLTLRNPDAELTVGDTENDAMTGQKRVTDGLANDRYQAFHKARFMNLTRTMDIAALTEYLARLTNNQIKIGIPLDAYGPESDWSQSWDFYATTPQCPTELATINRIIWEGHHIWILHSPGQQAPPCHQCAKLGHQAAACTTTEGEWINEHTLVVTTDDIRKCETIAGEQSPGEADWDHFLRLGQCDATEGEQGSTDTTTGQTKGQQQNDDHSSATAAETLNVGETQGRANAETDSQVAGSNDGSQAGSSGSTTETVNKGDEAKDQEEKKDNNKEDGAEWITVGGTSPAPEGPKNHSNNNQTNETASKKKKTKTNSKRPQATRSSLGNLLVIDEDDEADEGGEANKDDTDGSENKPPVRQNSTNDDDAEKNNTSQTTVASEKDNSSKHNTGAKSSKSKNKQFNHQETEEEALRSAIKAVQLQRLTDQINQNIEQHTDTYNRGHLKKKIEGALEHVTLKASKRWILNALDGLLTKTPETGNCQYHAATEASFQRDILQADENMQTAMVDHTILHKYALLVASEVIPSGEQIGTNLSAIVDGTPERTQKEQTSTPEARWKEYYRDIALSQSGVRDVVATRLWGGHDTQRTLAMARRRPVFNIREVDSRTAYVQYYYPCKTAAGTFTAKQAQPGLAEWLEAIKEDVERHKTAPVVLVLSGQHYQAVLFDKQRRVRDAKPPPALKSPTLLDLWGNLPTVDELIAAKRKPSNQLPNEDDGPTRQELLESNPTLDPADLIGVLGQRNWSTRAKLDAVAILVSEASNINDLLTFTPEHEAAEHSQGELMSAEEMELSDSTFESPTQRSEAESSQVDSQTTNPTSSPESAQDSSHFTSATGVIYQRQADEMWSGVQREWKEQYPGEGPPDLWDKERLTQWAKTKSTMLLEAGRWATNPFTMLEHMTVANIKSCVEEQRQEYLVTHLTEVVETIDDVQVKNELREWLHAIKQPAHVNVRRGQLRNEPRWAQLRQYAARFVLGPTALPFVKKEYSPMCAYVLILDELFPDIPRLAFQLSTSAQLPAVIRMTDVFQYVPAFRAAFAAAVATKKWEPIQAYFDMLMKIRDAGVDRN